MARKYDWEMVSVAELTEDEVESLRGNSTKPRNPNSASGMLRRALEPCKKGQGRNIGPLTEEQVRSARTVLPAVASDLGWRKHLRGRARSYRTKVVTYGRDKNYLKIVRL